MTLEEYEKVLEEKRKALQAQKTEGRKVDTSEFEALKPLSCKKDNNEIFAKLVGFFASLLLLICRLLYYSSDVYRYILTLSIFFQGI